MTTRTTSTLAIVAMGFHLMSTMASACTMPPSSSPEIEIEIEFEDYDDVRDRLLYKIEIEAEVVPPAQTAQCQCGIALGSTNFMAPDSFNVITAAVGVRSENGPEFDLEDFEGFAADGSVTTNLTGIPGINTGATAFGLSTEVDAFSLPTINPGDRLVLGFLIEFAPDDFSAINGTPIQVAAGSNEPGHPLAIFSSLQPTLQLPAFQLNPCDVDFDGKCDIDDLEAILSLGDLATGFPRVDSTEIYDLNGDDEIDLSDVDEWLAEAASFNGLSDPYSVGDTNLDGVVDSTDLGELLNNFDKNRDRWRRGNFNDDGVIDSTDLGLMLNHFNPAAAGSVSSIPEPGAPLNVAWALAIFAILGWNGQRRQTTLSCGAAKA